MQIKLIIYHYNSQMLAIWFLKFIAVLSGFLPSFTHHRIILFRPPILPVNRNVARESGTYL